MPLADVGVASRREAIIEKYRKKTDFHGDVYYKILRKNTEKFGKYRIEVKL
jgi:biotin synthase-related radical SAM superfamily protein